MSVALQALYPTDGGTTFNHDYYMTTHMDVVAESFGQFVEKVVITKEMANAPGEAPAYHAIATILFADQGQLDAALAVIAPAVDDIANFYSGKPVFLFGGVAL